MSNVNLIFFGMPQSLPLVNELGKHYTSKGGFDVRYMSSVTSLSTMLETSVNGIFIFKVENKKDLTDAVTILKTHRKLVKKGLLKPACVSKVKNKKVDKILSKYGCLDILEPNITPKTLSFKIDFWSRSIGTILKKAQLNNENLQVKSSATEVKEQELKVDIVLVDPLDLQSDIWLLKAKTDYKKILRRWLVRLLGPSPHAGSWVELEPQPGDQEPSWKYVLKNDDGQFVLEDGAWFFYGSKPDFDWKIQRWIFSSSTPHLYFYSRSGQVYSRIKYEKGQLLIAKNSEYAQMKENLILATCESKFEFLNEDQQSSPENREFDEDSEDLGGSLSGAAATEKLDNGPMAGSIRSDIDASKSPEKQTSLATEFEDIDGNLTGKSHTDNINNDPLRGKSSTDALDHSPLEGRVNNPLGAKEKAERESQGFSEDPIDGHLRGKSSTDALDHSPLEGRVNNPLSAKEKAERESEGFSEDPIDGHLRGTSSTDALDHSPLESSMKNPLDAKTRNTEDDGSDEDSENWADDISESPISSNYSSPLEGKNIQNPLAAPRASKAEDPSSANGNQNILKGSFKGGTVRDAVQGDIKQSLHSKDRERPAAPKQTIGTVANPFGGKRKRPDADVDFSEDLARLGEELPVINDGISKEIGESGESEASKDPSANVDMLGSAPKIDPTKKESEMDELLGGGLTEGAYSDTLREEVSNEIEDLDDQRDFQAIIGDGVDVNTESGEVKVVVKQETKNGNHITFLCQFDDLYEDELMVKAPKDSINTKSEVSVSLSMKYNQKKVQIASTGKIVDVEKDTDEPWDLLVIELKNIDKKKIEQFMSLYEERQESIHDFMNKAKGL